MGVYVLGGGGGQGTPLIIPGFPFFPFYYLPTRSFVHYINFVVVLFDLPL